jgi:predicted nucleic acid-binding protein
LISNKVLIDTGPLVALLSPQDRYHKVCTEQARELTGEVLTSWAVVTEAAWLLRNSPNGIGRLLKAINSRNIQCVHLDSKSYDWLGNAAKQYQDLMPQLADLSLLYLAEFHQIKHIFTLDRRDFAVFRAGDGNPFQLLPENI